MEYYSDDEYSYSADDDYLSEHEKVVHTTPNFVSVPSNQMVNEGDTIKLPCLVDAPLGKKSCFKFLLLFHIRFRLRLCSLLRISTLFLDRVRNFA